MPASTNARARVRAELTREIKDAARAELVDSGAAGLSLRAVARRIDMVPSALYRYFDGRDALLTALIIDAYASIADAATAAAASSSGGTPADRWIAIGRAVREWAWAHPSEWGLVYGAPVPAYDAPADTLEVGTAVVRLLIQIVLDAHPAGDAELPFAPRVTPELHEWLGHIRDSRWDPMSDRLLAAAAFGFTHLLGSISTELFGQFGKDATPAPEIFDAGLVTVARLLALQGVA